METLVRVGPKGQVTIPKKIREAVGLVEGELVRVEQDGDGRIVLWPTVAVPKSAYDESLRRRLRGAPDGGSGGKVGMFAAGGRSLKRRRQTKRSPRQRKRNPTKR